MSRRPLYVPLFWLLIVVLGIAGFWNAGSMHGGFRLQYVGVQSVPPSEFILYAWYALFSCMVIAGTAVVVQMTRLGDWLASAAAHRRWVVFGAAGFVLVAALVVRYVVLLDEPVADDELTYRFIAQTLLSGSVVNTPPIDPDFLWNQFVIADADRWFGKYPIGHPAFLAVGEAVGLRGLVTPVLTAASVLLTHAVGRKLFDDRVALLACVLMAMSPHLVMTAGTDLSQPTEMFLMLCGIWCALRLESDSRLRWAALAGAAWGGAVLVRPLPGGLFLIVAAVAFCVYALRHDREHLRTRLIQLAVAGLVAAVFGAIILIVNRLETGGVLESAYSVAHGSQLPPLKKDVIAASLGAAALRQSFWLLAAPALIALIAFARPRRSAALFWGLILAEYAYRVIAPKTVVSTTGPVYVHEIVPLLALATADGAFRVSKLVERLDVARIRHWLAGVFIGVGVASATMFLPVQIDNIHNGAWARNRVERQLDLAGVTERSLIFVNRLVQTGRSETWAYHPENPKPDLSNHRLFLRFPRGDDWPVRIRALWLEKFPDRRAFGVNWEPGAPLLIELSRPGAPKP